MSAEVQSPVAPSAAAPEADSEHETVSHYSSEVALFEGFLDPYMKYSSGDFETWEEPLDVGILRMLDRHLDGARLAPGARVLDVGNGWGCLLKRLRERTDLHDGELDYTGVNPSAVQIDYIRREVEAEARILHGPVEDVMDQLEGPYDAIFLVGSLCHFKDKLATLRGLAAHLAPGGRIVMEDTFFLSEQLYQAHKARTETKFVQEKIFGYAHVTSLAAHMDILRAAKLRVRHAWDNSEHYAHVIDVWTERLQEMDPARFQLAPAFIAYMDVFQRGWGYTICNWWMVLEPLPQRRKGKVAIPGTGAPEA